MIIGVGIDMVEVPRIAGKIASGSGFLERVFSQEEIAYCNSCADPAQHFAARFAAKEAFLKAAGTGLALGFDLCDICVLLKDSGEPYMELRNSFRSAAGERNWNRIHVSLSHLNDFACAVVTIES